MPSVRRPCAPSAPLTRSRRCAGGRDPHSPCAVPNRAAARAPVPLLLLLPLLAAAACAPEASAEDRRASEQIDHLVESLTPLPADLTSDKLDAHFHYGQALLAEMRQAGPAVGREAMARLRQGVRLDGEPIEAVERGLLDVAAHAAPEDSRPLLESLVQRYGPSLMLRTEAVLLLAEVHPERAIEILEPLVVETRQTQTLPPAEFLVRGYVTACERTGRSPVRVLADVASNLFQDETARIRAVKELGHRDEPLATQTLTAILIESTGDGYIRRMAVQGLVRTLAREDACGILRQVADREADLNMLGFLRDVLEKNCGW